MLFRSANLDGGSPSVHLHHLDALGDCISGQSCHLRGVGLAGCRSSCLDEIHGLPVWAPLPLPDPLKFLQLLEGKGPEDDQVSKGRCGGWATGLGGVARLLTRIVHMTWLAGGGQGPPWDSYMSTWVCCLHTSQASGAARQQPAQRKADVTGLSVHVCPALLYTWNISHMKAWHTQDVWPSRPVTTQLPPAGSNQGPGMQQSAPSAAWLGRQRCSSTLCPSHLYSSA